MSENIKSNALSSATKDNCFTVVVFAMVFIIVVGTLTACWNIARETSARLCAEYNYQCEEDNNGEDKNE